MKHQIHINVVEEHVFIHGYAYGNQFLPSIFKREIEHRRHQQHQQES